ncbi:hypothetical protein HID58_011053 [Brassica napus]|uniref:tRNA pseudouridine synthase n=1 Tax=Brassica napus TaxID=3708 RepID=A0ABQ8DZS1_BRANA|nr:hypothetical protein HID58_011053 [Brassica napus]
MSSATPALPPSLCTKGSLSSPHNISKTDLNSFVKISDPGGFKWRLVIAYDGTKFAGSSFRTVTVSLSWQYQESPPTVQSMLEKALTQITKLQRKELHLVGAGRTDAGVHAWGQVAHFVTPFNYTSLDSIHSALNGLLPQEIRVREIGAAVPEFHARFSCRSKVYRYQIYSDTFMDPFQRHFAYHTAYKLNACKMREAAQHFVGKHDFSAFANATREDGGSLLQLEVEGSGFMYRQVRNMVKSIVALLVQVGKEALDSDIVPMILETKDRRELAKYTLPAPPHGLCLVSVKYKEDHLQLPPDSPLTSFGRHHTITKCKLPFY